MKKIKLNALIIVLFFTFFLSNGNSQARQAGNMINSSQLYGYQRSNMDVLGLNNLDVASNLTVLALSSLNVSRGNFASVGTNDHIYVLGGHTPYQSSLKSIEVALTNPDGSLGSWLFTTPMIEGREGHAAVIAENRIYVFGGIYFSTTGMATDIKSVEYVDINSNGSLGPWKSSVSLINYRFGPGAVTDGTRVYVIGGYETDTGDELASVEFATINPDGSLDS
jgi:hypothetical protein